MHYAKSCKRAGLLAVRSRAADTIAIEGCRDGVKTRRKEERRREKKRDKRGKKRILEKS